MRRSLPEPQPLYDWENERQFRSAVLQELQQLSLLAARTPVLVESETLAAGSNNDYVIGSDTEFLRITPNGAGSSLTGIAGGVASRKLRIVNLGSAALAIKHQDTGSSAVNRIITPDAVDWSLPATDVVDLEYDAVTARWRVVEAHPIIAVGTYTPTLTGVTNVTASSAYVMQYLRVGSRVLVSGNVNVTPTGAGPTELGISLPIASALATNLQCRGTAASPQVSGGMAAAILGDVANARASMVWDTLDFGSDRPMSVVFMYQLL